MTGHDAAERFALGRTWRTPLPPALAFALTAALLGVSSVLAAPPAGSEGGRALLEACLRAQAVMDHASMRVVSRDRAPVDPLYKYHERFRRGSRYVWLIRRDGDLIDAAGSHFLGGDAKPTTKYREVFAKKTFVGYNFETAQQRGPTSASASTSPKKQQARYFLDADQTGAFLDGYLPGSGGKRVTALALESADRVSLSQAAIGGIPCTRVAGQTPYGRIVLWIAPSKGYLPLKITYEKGPLDIFDEQRIADLPDEPPGLAGPDTPVEDRVRKSGYGAVVDDIKVAKVDGVDVPVAGRVSLTMHWLKNGREKITRVIECRSERTDIQLNPSFAGTDAFQTDLPNGATIGNLDDPNSGIIYMWQDGKIVPMSAVFQGKPAEGHWTGRAILVAVAWAALGLTLLVGALWLARRARSA